MSQLAGFHAVLRDDAVADVIICDAANVVENVKPKIKPEAGLSSTAVTQVPAFHKTISAEGDSGQLSPQS